MTTKTKSPKPRARRARFIGWLTLILALALLFAPQAAYTVEMPGPTGDVLGAVSSKAKAPEMIEVSGAKSFKDPGKLLLTTVSAFGVPGYPATNAQVLWAWFQKDTIVVPQELEYPVNQTADDYKQETNKQMSGAQEAAQTQALAFLKRRGIAVDRAKVSMHVDDIGGPSAGMMYTLGTIDKFTAVNETGGKVIAGTGTMEKNGKIGPIGGIRLKMVGAVRDGARWFIAPTSNCDEVTGHIPSGLHVVAVSNLDQAYDALVAIGQGKTDGLKSCPVS